MTPPAAAPAFLAAHGWVDAEILPLAGDASFRRYFRVLGRNGDAVLMDAPPPHEDPRPFVDIARWLRGEGFAAPAIHATDFEHGLVLLEDFGDARMREVLDDDPSREHSLYEQAIDLLIELHGCGAAPVRDYADTEYHREAGLFTEWYCPAVGLDVDGGGYRAAWTRAFSGVLRASARVTVLRDYHAENLMVMDEGKRLGLLDFQDALIGHPAYDLVSLLQDARRDVPVAIEAAMLQRYRAATGAGDAFDAAYHVLGAQRNAKIIGIFTRLWQRDGKPRYPTLVPRVWGYLERDLAHPALAEVAHWFDANVPVHRRGDPMLLSA